MSELVTNAVKYASPAGSAGHVWVTLTSQGDDVVVLSVKDSGPGLPDSFEVNRSGGLGMKIVQALAGQMQMKLTRQSHHPGLEFVLEIPLETAAPGGS